MAHHATCGRHTQTDTDQADAHDDSVTDSPCDTDRVRATQGQHTVAQPAQNQTHRLDPTASHGARDRDAPCDTDSNTETQIRLSETVTAQHTNRATHRQSNTLTETHRITLSDTKTQTETDTQTQRQRHQETETQRHTDRSNRISH